MVADDDTLSQLSRTDWTTFAVLSNPDHVNNVPNMMNIPYTSAPLDREEEPRVVDITPEPETRAKNPPEQYLPTPIEEGMREARETEREAEKETAREHASEEHHTPSAPFLQEQVQGEQENDPLSYSKPPPVEEKESPPAPPAFVPPLEDEETKRTLLLDLQALIVQGMQPTKSYSMEDRTEDIMLEIRRLTLAMDEASNVGMMRDGLRLFVTGVEMINSRIGLLDLEGWSADVCRDMNKHDPNLSRIYRRWWKRSTSSSPELDLCLSLVGSMGFHHMKRTMSKQLISGGRNGFSADRTATAGPSGTGNGFRRRSRPQRPATPPSSDEEDEGLPPSSAR